MNRPGFTGGQNPSINPGRFNKLLRERKKLVQSILGGVPSTILKDDAVQIEARMTKLNRIMEGISERPILFTAEMAERYKREVSGLSVRPERA